MREAGILMPVASLPSDYGVGDLGGYSYRFVDLLREGGATIWQILPLNPLGFGNSPYQPYSSIAGDELYISLEELHGEGLLEELPKPFQKDGGTIAYDKVRRYKEEFFRKAFQRFHPDGDYEAFAAREWVYPYAVYLTLKKQNGMRCWNEWKPEHRNWIRDKALDLSPLEEEIRYEMFLQYQFHKQWMKLKEYANGKGLKIMGDIPFYVGIDSLDVWANQECFLLDREGRPTFIAGVPPDYFSATGQRWGNPIYDWDHLERTGFRFWIDRLVNVCGLFDIVRVDHFRAFDTYWKIPASCPTAVEGEWMEAPGYAFFDQLFREHPNLNIVAEDLGYMREEVYQLRDHYRFKGMKIIQFSFDPREEGNKFPDRENLMAYTGTHDNQTIAGWVEGQPEEVRIETDLILAGLGYGEKDMAHRFVHYTMDNTADMAIIPLQDLLSLDDEARINTPGTLGSPNWEWRLESFAPLEENLPFLGEVVRLSGRSPANQMQVRRKLEPERILQRYLEIRCGKAIAEATPQELCAGLMMVVKLLARQVEKGKETQKKLYYISAEFLMGKLLGSNLISLGLYDEMKGLLERHGRSLAAVEEAEPEPSLGNGGLGRLAACYLDSVATMGLNGDGVGLNYHFGLFRQKFRDRLQQEEIDPWIQRDGWLTKTGREYGVHFGACSVKGVMYDVDVVGYRGRCNKLHLFDVETVDEDLVKKGIAFDKTDIPRNLTLFLYPDDGDEEGRLLRVYQQYFMVSCAAQYILDECVSKGCRLTDLHKYAAIQINDTHPSLVIPELIRLLMERGIGLRRAAKTVAKTCAYTNHTILAEALEKWPLEFIRKVAPQLVPIIRYLDSRVKRKIDDPGVQIIDNQGRVHMAHMDIHYGHSVNGVAALHTEILQETELAPFYQLYPEKFNNKTNGVTFRRWLLHCNPQLAGYLTSLIGDGYLTDGDQLEKLERYRDDPSVLEQLLSIKQANKDLLAEYLLEKQGVTVDPNSIFDIQIKRLHEYKRQQMNAMYLIHKYLEIKEGKKPTIPVTAVFGAKAAPAYTIAKDIIHLILCLQDLINGDPEVSPHLKVVMVENYNVSAAEKLIPACDISEQISLASKEASGTGNMKFMLNGAVTLGTLDGANVEISELVGKDNIYLFGEKSPQIIRHYQRGDYVAREFYEKDPEIRRVMDFFTGKELAALGSMEHLKRLREEILNKDWFMALLDFQDYKRVKDLACGDFAHRTAWAGKMLVNISRAGYFSSDRAVAEYNRDIWKLDKARSIRL